MERAEAVKRYLYEQHQIPLHKMNVISYGEEQAGGAEQHPRRPRPESPRRDQGAFVTGIRRPKGFRLPHDAIAWSRPRGGIAW